MIIGVQLVTFAIYTERLAALLGLRGSCSMQTQSEPRFSLELGLVIGLAMFLIGVGLLAWKTTEWGLSGFGPLVPEVSMRTVIPAVVCMTHGFQILFGSFFLSFLTLAKSQLDRHFK